MAAQPTDEDIEMVRSLTNITRSEAISRLKGNNNNVSQAVNEYYENPGRNPYAWDETHFNSDRDGSNNKAGISFQIQGADDHGTSSYMCSAPSRPPSRSNTRSPLGRSLSQADGQQDVNPEKRMTANELHDADLKKALAQSAQEAGLPPQEYGVTNANGVQFGPATRDTYEHSQWQLIHLPSASVPEAPSDPPAEDRKRENGTPAFLKPSADGSRLASIITIYHEIPLIREIFLRRENILPDFGHDREWWAGKAITRTRDYRRSPPGDLLFHELQRLMAFLDKTDRCYGSAEPLSDLKFVKDAAPDDLEAKFFDAWKRAQGENPALAAIFSEAVQPRGDALPEDSETGARDFAILDLRLPDVSEPEEYETIYDLTDRILWMNSGLDIGTSAYLTHVADVVGFRLIGFGSSRSVSIPEIWFPDRYLEEGREAALEMRRQKAEIRGSMMKLNSLEQLLRYFTLPDGKTVKVHDIFNISLRHDAGPMVEDAVNGTDSDNIDMDMNGELRVGDKIDVSAELHKLMASVDKKLEAIDKEKEKALSSLHELSKLFTQEYKEPHQLRLHKYKLCGVSTTKEITYLRRQAEPDLIDMDLDATEPQNCEDQWWKIKYASVDAKPVMVMKVTLEDVLTAAMTESKTSIVIYASERSMAEPIHPLPDSLESFIRADNLAFSAEFPHNVELQDSQSSVASPVSPGKRKYEDSSDGSVEAPPRYTEQPRWGGRSPRHEDGVIISHQEVDGSDDGRSNEQGWPMSAYESSGESVTPRGSESHDVIMGQDPNELAEIKFPALVQSESLAKGLEMREIGGMPGMLTSAMNETVNMPSIIDSMDVDEMTVDGAYTDTEGVHLANPDMD